MKQKDEILLFEEEIEYAIKSLTKLTKDGTVKWNCTNYNPLSLMPTNNDTKAYVCHIIEAQAQHNGHNFTVEISDTINIPSGRGDVSIIFTPEWGEDQSYSKSISDYDPFEKCPTDQLVKNYKDTLIMILSDAVFPQLEKSATVLDAKKYGHFLTQYYQPHIANSPIVALSRILHETDRLNDFHRCVLDMEYRKQLMLENGII